MTLEPQIRTRTRIRRLSACFRHPDQPVTGFCTLCLRERLAGLDPTPHLEPSSSNPGGDGASMTSRRRTKAAVPSSSFSPELRRSKSVSSSRWEALSGLSEPRRKSCDVGARKTLCHLFNIDDEKNGLMVESKNLGFPRLAGPVLQSREEQIRVSEVEEEVKTMKEHIDLEWQTRKQNVRDLRDIAGSFWVAASVFSKKLRKWRQNQKIKKRNTNSGGDRLAMRVIGRQFGGTQSEIADYGFGRRSCDTEPRFSVDAARMSLDDSRFSFEEPRASWDGYLIARTIPRLTPMLSVVENVMLAPVNRSDNSDSSCSQRGSSFDCSSSVKSSNAKTLELEVDEVKSIANAAKVSPARVDIFHGTKLVITERELKDWHLNSLKDESSENFASVSEDATSVGAGGTPNRFKKSSSWRKVCNMWGSIHGLGDNKYKDFTGNVVNPLVTEAKGASSGKLMHSSSVSASFMESCKTIGSHHSTSSAKKGREEFVMERNRGARYSPSNFDTGLLRFYLTPFRSYGRSKSGKSRLKNSHSVARSDIQLN